MDAEEQWSIVEEVEKFDLDAEYKFLLLEPAWVYKDYMETFKCIAFSMIHSPGFSYSYFQERAHYYSDLLYQASKCQGILKAWQSRLWEQGFSWAQEERISLTTFDKSTVLVGVQEVDTSLNLYQQPQEVRVLLRRLSLGRVMEDMGSKEQFEELIKSVRIAVSLAKKGIMKILGDNIKHELPGGRTLTLPETALKIVINYSHGDGGLLCLGFVKKEVPHRVTEAVYLGSLCSSLSEAYNQMKEYMFEFGDIRKVCGKSETAGESVELEEFGGSDVSGKLGASDDCEEEVVLNLSEDNVKFKLTDESNQRSSENRHKLRHYGELLHTLLPELGVDLEDMEVGEQDEKGEQNEEEEQDKDGEQDQAEVQEEEKRKQQTLDEEVLQDIEKAEEILQDIEKYEEILQDLENLEMEEQDVEKQKKAVKKGSSGSKSDEKSEEDSAEEKKKSAVKKSVMKKSAKKASESEEESEEESDEDAPPKKVSVGKLKYGAASKPDISDESEAEEEKEDEEEEQPIAPKAAAAEKILKSPTRLSFPKAPPPGVNEEDSDDGFQSPATPSEEEED